MQFNNFQIENIQLSAKNNFSFKLNKKYKINNLEIFTDMKIDKMFITSNNKKIVKEFFPKIKKNFEFLDHSIKIKYSKKQLSINGNGKVLFQNENDRINYSISKIKDIFKFNTSLEIINNPLDLKILNFKKDIDSKLTIDLEGEYQLNNLTKISSLNIREKENIFKLKKLIFDKKFKIKEFKDLTFDYTDIENKKTQLGCFIKMIFIFKR